MRQISVLWLVGIVFEFPGIDVFLSEFAWVILGIFVISLGLVSGERNRRRRINYFSGSFPFECFLCLSVCHPDALGVNECRIVLRGRAADDGHEHG